MAVLSKGEIMAEGDEPKEYATWLPVIGKALAYLCLAKAMETEAGAEKYKSVPGEDEIPGGLGLPEKDAAFASGSTAESVRVAKYNKSKAKNGTAKKAKTRGRKR